MQRFSVWRYRSYNNFTIMLLRFHSHLWIFLFDIPACPHGPSTIIFSTTGQWCSERFILFLILVIHSTHCTPFLIYVLKKTRTSSELINNSEGWLCRPTYRKQWPNCGIFLQQQLCKFSQRETTSLTPCFSVCQFMFSKTVPTVPLGPRALPDMTFFLSSNPVQWIECGRSINVA